MSELINGCFFVNSNSSDKIYKITRDLVCDCEAGKYKRRCKHVQEVLDDIADGKFVETKNTLLAKEYHYQFQRIQ